MALTPSAKLALKICSRHAQIDSPIQAKNLSPNFTKNAPLYTIQQNLTPHPFSFQQIHCWVLLAHELLTSTSWIGLSSDSFRLQPVHRLQGTQKKKEDFLHNKIHVMYEFAQTNWWNKIERCYVCVCTNKWMKQNRTMLCMHLHKQIDETK
jgi:hypothetical protein